MHFCTQINEAQKGFQDCSHKKSLAAWDKIKNENNDGQDNNNIDEAETETLTSAAKKEILCTTLEAIGRDCVLSITKCFSTEDTLQMRRSHLVQMMNYYSTLYDGLDLSDCPVMLARDPDELDLDHSEDDYNEEDGEEDDDYYEEYATGAGRAAVEEAESW